MAVVAGQYLQNWDTVRVQEPGPPPNRHIRLLADRVGAELRFTQLQVVEEPESLDKLAAARLLYPAVLSDV